MSATKGTLVVTFTAELTREDAEQIKADLSERLPDVEVVVIQGASSATWLPDVRTPRARPPLTAR